MQDNSVVKNVNWTEFENAAKKGYISHLIVNNEKGNANGVLTPEGVKYFKLQQPKDGEAKIHTNIINDDNLQDRVDAWNEELQKQGKPSIEVNYEKESDLTRVIWYVGPFVLIILFMFWMTRRVSGGNGAGGGIFSVGKSRARLFDKNNDTKTTFKDVAGLKEAKVEVEEIVEFLKNPQKYTELGAKIPRGALLVGPPGTGKTLLAKAVAGEADVPFLSMSGSDFVEMFVGVGAARVRDLFKQAKEKAPCIVFIDEIDAVGRARGKNPNMGSNDERENTLNQMLTEMDGFSSNDGVIILAATNRADMLDKALLRPGRFDRQINVDLPELSDRVEIFNVHLRNLKVSARLDVERLAKQTQGFSGADIANVCNEAALHAARYGKTEVEWDDFMAAIDRIVAGLEKSSLVLTPDEKSAIAVHEAGHATVGWMLKYGNPLLKVSIVPRGRALGLTWYTPEDRTIMPKQAMLDTICGLLGGRAAEDIFLGEVGTGAGNDLERSFKIARAYVTVYGMSDKLPNLNYYDSTGQELAFNRPYSEETAKIVDDEILRIINEQYERAKEILRKYKEQIIQMRDLLLEKEVIYSDDVEAILGKRIYKSRTDLLLEMEGKKKTPEVKNADTSAPSDSSESTGTSDSDNDDDDETPPTFVRPKS